MALIIDTRFLLDHTFPSTDEDRDQIIRFLKRLKQEKIYIPSVVIVEYLKVAGKIIGISAAKTKIRIWINSGVEPISLRSEEAMEAGEQALRTPNIPLADIIIATLAKKYRAKIVSDDPYYKAIGVPTTWYK